MINIHEEIGSIDNGLPKNAIRKEAKIRHCKEGWIEEIDKKLGVREIEIRDNAEKEIVKS